MDGWITIGTKLDTKSFDTQIEQLEKKLNDLESDANDKDFAPKEGTEEYYKLNTEIEKTRNKLIDLRKQQEKMNKTGFNGVQESMSGIGDSTNKLIKKITKWGLAVFSIRSAYQFVRQSVSTLAQYNEQIGTDIEYIRFALATTLQPIIEWMIKAVYTLLQYVNYLAKQWFHIDLFANASAKNFNKMNKSAKDLKNTLAGFDEMNVLGDTSGQTKTPSVDLSQGLGEVEIPEWLKTIGKILQPIADWIRDIIDNEGVVGVLKAILAVIGGFIILKTIGSIITGLFTKDISAGVSNFFTSLGKAAESIAILGGLALVIETITDLITTFSESGMTLGEVAGLLGIVLGELAITFGALMVIMTKMQPSWQSIAAAAVILGGLALVIKSVSSLLKTMKDAGMGVGDVFGVMATITGSLVALIIAFTLAAEALQSPLAMAGLAVLAASICATLLVMAQTLPTILDAVGKFITQIAPVVIQLLTTIGNIINSIINSLGKVLPPIINSVGGVFKTIFDGIAKVVKTVGDSLNNILSGVGSLVKSVLGSILNFIERLGPAINTFVDNAIAAVTKLINFMISGIEYLVNTLIIGGVNKIIDAINSIGKYVGMTIGRLDRFSIPRFRPTFAAKGAIINMPGKGVPVGNGVYGGERGQEGVIPLSDSQQMELLGESIGKYITINANIVNQMNGRVISRELKKIESENNFAYNG